MVRATGTGIPPHLLVTVFLTSLKAPGMFSKTVLENNFICPQFLSLSHTQLPVHEHTYVDTYIDPNTYIYTLTHAHLQTCSHIYSLRYVYAHRHIHL